MGNWDIPGIPHKGWTVKGVLDLEEPIGSCEMCSQERVRYIHTMEHPDYIGSMAVGCICAEKMCIGYDGKAAENRIKNRSNRRDTFLTNWNISAKGNYWKKKNQHLITIGKNKFNDLYWLRIDDDFHPKKFKSVTDAKLAAFEELEL